MDLWFDLPNEESQEWVVWKCGVGNEHQNEITVVWAFLVYLFGHCVGLMFFLEWLMEK